MNPRFIAAALAGIVAIAIPGPGLLRSRVARACGGFFTPRVVESNRRPSLAYEQTLIVYDDNARREHFVREVVFRALATCCSFPARRSSPTPSDAASSLARTGTIRGDGTVLPRRPAPFERRRILEPYRRKTSGITMLRNAAF
jgi:hypothetical protein